MDPARKAPTLAGLEALPPGVKGEIIELRAVHDDPASRPASARVVGDRQRALLIERPSYAKIGVRHHWLVDLDARTVTAYALHGEQWLELGTWSDEHDARIPPFDAVAIDVSRWWA